jgi:hypothetical protein
LSLFETFSSNAVQPSVAIDDGGKLYVVWSDLQTGEIYFSWAEASQAFRRNEWATPQILPTFGLVTRSPVVFIDSSGTIHVAYVVPFNEERGVYLVQSIDEGRTWMDPILVFDAERAGWEMVDQPNITGMVDGSLHILWTQSTLPDGSGPLSLYYTSSVDGGRTWTAPEVVVEGRVEWNQILGYQEQTLHRLWWESSYRLPVIRHQVSYNGGLTWSPATSISSFGEASGSPGVAIDNAGQLQVVQIFREDGDKVILRNWQWMDQQWTTGENLDFGKSTGVIFIDLAAYVSPPSSLEVVFSVEDTTTQGRDFISVMNFTSRFIDDSPLSPIPVTTLELTPSPTIEENEPPSPTLTSTTIPATPTESSANLVPGPPSSNTSYQGIFYGSIIAGFIVIAIFVIYMIRKFLTG